MLAGGGREPSETNYRLVMAHSVAPWTYNRGRQAEYGQGREFDDSTYTRSSHSCTCSALILNAMDALTNTDTYTHIRTSVLSLT